MRRWPVRLWWYVYDSIIVVWWLPAALLAALIGGAALVVWLLPAWARWALAGAVCVGVVAVGGFYRVRVWDTERGGWTIPLVVRVRRWGRRGR